MEVSVVIPAYNEASVIRQTVADVHAYWSSVGLEFEVIVVDDGSLDATATAVEELRLGSVRVWRQPNQGKGAALRVGIAASKGESVYFIDADLPYTLEDQQKVVRMVQNGVPVAVGSRRVAGALADDYPIFRRVCSWALSMLVCRSLNVVASDTQCGLKAFRGELARWMFPLTSIDGFGLDLELFALLAEAGIPVEECPVTLRHERASSVSLVHDSLAMLGDLRRIRRRNRDRAELFEAKNLASEMPEAREEST